MQADIQHDPECSQPEVCITVLVVDDDLRFRQGMDRLFRIMRPHARFLSREAAGGQEALSALTTSGVDCVLLDFQMPGGNGLEWLERILSAHPDLPVVMITGHGDEQIAVAALKQGAMDYLVKGSITPENLRRAITNAVEKSRMRLQIQAQRRQLIDAERHRAMVESLGAACHHLGQPATTLQCSLELARRTASGEPAMWIDRCIDSAQQLADVIHRLQTICAFQTTPYRPLLAGEKPRSDVSIVDIGVPPSASTEEP